MSAGERDRAALDAFIDSAAAVLGLAIEPDWKPGVRENLVAGLGMAELVASFPLPTAAEPAPHYVPDPASGGGASGD